MLLDGIKVFNANANYGRVVGADREWAIHVWKKALFVPIE